LVQALAECRRQVAELKSSIARLERAREGESGDLFHDLLEALDVVIWMASADDGQLLYINDTVQQLYGRPRNEFLENPDLWYDAVHPEDKERVAEASDALIEQGAVEIEYRILRPNGEVRWVHDKKYVVYGGNGGPREIGGVAYDVTRRKWAEQALRKSEEKARRLSEAAFEGIVIHEGGTIIETNQVFADMLGYEMSELLGMDGLELVAAESRDLVAEHIASGYQQLYEATMVRKDGTKLPVEFLGKMMDYQGRSLRVVAVRDIRSRKRREETIRRQAEEILEVSTPTLKVWDGVVLAPLVGTLDSQRSQRLTEALLNVVVETSSEIALVDITGVPAIDTQTAHHLIEMIAAVRLLGADVVLTGVRPAIAQTLVHLGIDLSGITTRSSLAAGLRDALEMMEASV
jgi:PAS domain S-box-containing protein